MARKSEKLRALWHALFGILAVVYGQIIRGTYDAKVILARTVGGWIVFVDIFVRLPLYYVFIRPEDVSRWGPIRLKSRVVFIFLERWICIKTKWIRPHERGFPAAATPFVLGILIPLEFGAPLYAAMVGILVLGFGDPSAREAAILIYKKFKVRNRIRKNGKKTWQGFWGFVIVAGAAVLVSVILDRWFPIYPNGHTVQLTLALVLGVFAGAFAELTDELIEVKTRKWSKWLRKVIRLFFDDNFTIPIAVVSTITLVMAI